MAQSPVRIILCLVCAILFSQLLYTPARADSGGENKWNFQLGTYAWLAGQSGTVSTLPGLPPADIDIDFSDDIVGNISGAFFLVGEARKGRWGIFTDIAYVDIEIEDESLEPYFSNLESGTKSWIVSAAGLYRMIERPRAFLDVIAGVRYWSVESTLDLSAGILPARKISNKESWVDPLVGLKGLSFFGESRFFASGGLAIGGFGVGSDFMWDVNGNLGYQWTKTFSTVVGYRYLDVDYEEDEFLYDVAQHGPVLGLSWRF
jgi:hypothetical protein